MSEAPKVYVAAVGVITAVGGNAPMTNAAIKSGISRYSPTGYYNHRNYAMIGTFVPEDAMPSLNEKLKWIGLTGREKRLIRLASVALLEVYESSVIKSNVPMFLAGPENISNSVRPVTGNILKQIQVQSDVSIDLGKSRYFATGRAGVIEAIDLAFKYFESSEERYVLVGGVDTYLDPAMLSSLDMDKRVIAENISDGFAPGEGAAFLLLTRDRAKAEYPAALFKPGLAIEEGHRYSDEPYRGNGLADAFSASISNAGVREIDAIFSTMNGESFGIKEFGVANVRNSAFLNPECEHIHPADCIGDVGAAAGAILISLALSEYEQGRRSSPVLIYGASDFSNRAAICLSTIT